MNRPRCRKFVAVHPSRFGDVVSSHLRKTGRDLIGGRIHYVQSNIEFPLFVAHCAPSDSLVTNEAFYGEAARLPYLLC